MTKKQNMNLIEILVVTAIIAILSTMGISKYNSMVQRAQISKTMTELESISAAITNYKSEYGKLPHIGDTYPTSDITLSFSEILPILRGDNLRGLNFLNNEVSSHFQIGDTKNYVNYSYIIALDYDHNGTIDSSVFSGITAPEITQDLLATSAVWMKSPNKDHSDLYSWISLDLNNNRILAANGTPNPISSDGGNVVTESNYPPSDTNLSDSKNNKGFGNNTDGIDTDNKNWEKKAKKDGWTDEEIQAEKDRLAAENGADNDEKK